MSNVSLVFPRFKYPSGDFSLGLTYLSAYLKKEIKNIEVDLIDTTFNPTMNYVSDRIKESKPDIVGIYISTLMHKDAMEIAEIAKSHSAFVVAGGPHSSILPQTVINKDCIDVVCIGEGEKTFTQLVKEFYGDGKFEGIEGIWFKKNETIVKNPPSKPIKDLDSLPFPDLDIFDVETYIKNFIQLDSYSTNLRGLSVIVSRGCPFHCSYCQPTLNKIFGKKFRIRSPLNVIKELIKLKKKYNLNAFYFQDDTLTVSKDWLIKFSDLAIAKKLNMVWACNTRADLLNYKTMEKMKQAGLVKLKVGIESVTDRISNGIYQKGIKIEQVNRLILAAKELGIQVAGFFMLGAPTETKNEIFNTIKFAVESDLKEANFAITVPLPETGLFEMANKKGWNLPINYSQYDYYHANRSPITNSDISSKKLELYKRMAYIFFYFHPKRFLHSVKTLIGFNNLKKALQKIKRF